MITQRIPVSPGTREEPAEIEIEMINGGTVRGTVVTPDGDPVPNVRVYYNEGNRGSGYPGGQVNSDDQGRFLISGPPKESTLTVYAPSMQKPARRFRSSTSGWAVVNSRWTVMRDPEESDPR